MLKAAIAFAVVALLIPLPSAAKGPLDICGPAACIQLGDEASAMTFLAPSASINTTGATVPSAYFALRFHATNGSPVGYWVPSANALDLNGVWTAVSPEQAALLQEQTVGLAAYQPRVDWAWVGSRLVKRTSTASSYLRLYTIGTPLDAVPSVGFEVIQLISFTESPWYTSGSSLMISRKGAVLLRFGKPLKIPAGIARRIRAGQPLA